MDASEQPGPGKIRNGNQYSLLGQALQAGAEVTVLTRTTDDKEQIEGALSSAADACDLLIICGGVSVETTITSKMSWRSSARSSFGKWRSSPAGRLSSARSAANRFLASRKPGFVHGDIRSVRPPGDLANDRRRSRPEWVSGP